MFSWGEDCEKGFRLRSSTDRATEAGLHRLDLGFHIRDLSVGHRVLSFIKANGDPFIIHINESKDGERARGRQKFIKCKEKIKAVTCADDVVTLLSDTGKVLCVHTSHSNVPKPLEALSSVAVAQVACGSQHSVALTKDGQVYTWGLDSRGQLGQGKRKPGATSPQHLPSLSAMPLVQVAAGGEQSFALSVSGGLFGWGSNHCGQLGLGDTTDRHTPTSVHYLNMKKTVHVSCGKDHTAILTKDGAVFTFGSGQYGQLGHNSFSDERRPRLVAELWGARVTRIACGRCHTLVLTDSKRMYSFGCGEQGQLGHGEESHPSVPLPVQLPQDAANGEIIRNIYAGGDCSFATYTSTQDNESNADDVSNITRHCIDDMIDKWTSDCSTKSWKKIKLEIHKMFSSASCMNQSFLDRSKDKHFQTSPKHSGLNLSLARLSFKKLLKKEDVLAEVEGAVLHLLPSLHKKPVGVEALRVFLLLSELLHVIQKHNRPQMSTKLAESFAAAIQSLPTESRQLIGGWWSSLSPSTMVKHVKVWTRALSVVLSSQPVLRNSGVKNLLLVLQYLYDVNRQNEGHHRIPEKTFCFEVGQAFLQEDLELWRLKTSKTKAMNDQPLILCNFPFAMDLKSKKTAFDIYATGTQNKYLKPPTMVFDWVYGWIPQSYPDFFELNLKRSSLLEGAFTQLAAAHHSAFKKTLMVHLDEDPKFTRVYRSDFFHHLFHDMVSAKSGMFSFNDSKTLAWFPSKVREEDKKNFFLFGVLCGLALYNQSIIHLPFPLALFKKLLDIEPTLEDMREFSPSVAQSLQYILDYEDDHLEKEDFYFTINWAGTDVNLDPQNPEKQVTSQNKKEFVDAYVNFAFNTSVEGVFREFKRGFFQVCDRDPVKLFLPKELQQVLVGQDVYDWAKFKQNTVYLGKYYVEHPTIQMFWEVFDELTEDQKKDFIWFLTGFRRVPILGMDQIQMKVRDKIIEHGSDDQHFPESLTCHSILELPLYSNKDAMRDRLTQALIPERGFMM